MKRVVALVLAYLFLALSMVGIFLPGLPTVPFLLLSAWFAAQGSKQLHAWLYAHPHIGKILTDWEEQKAISTKSKLVAVLMLIISWVVMYHQQNNIWALTCITVLFVIVSGYIVSRPRSK